MPMPDQLSKFLYLKFQMIKAQSQLVLSLFHGIDIFGRAFDAEGFCVVRAAEIDLGFDIRDFHPVKHRFDGIIAGSPCQPFSVANRTRSHKSKINCDCPGCQMLKEFSRSITEAQPKWFLLENVPQVPDVIIPGYKIQRFDLRANECGLKQIRLRHFQFGSLDEATLEIERGRRITDVEPAAMASDGKKSRRSFTRLCELQGLPPDFELPYFKDSYKKHVIGNGVAFNVGRTVAKAIRDATCENSRDSSAKFCGCFCGRRITGKQKFATPACRKRMQYKRERALINSESQI